MGKKFLTTTASIPSPLLSVPSPPLPLPSPPTNTNPTYNEALLGYKAAGIRLRAASPPTHHLSEVPSPPLLQPSTLHRDDLLKRNMPLWKRARFTTPVGRLEVRESSAAATTRQHGLYVATVDATLDALCLDRLAMGLRMLDDMVGDMKDRALTIVEGLSQRVTDLSTTLAQDTHEIYVRLEDAQDDRAL
nr:hypothetical protein [Tanacetum cinerariifolium]